MKCILFFIFPIFVLTSSEPECPFKPKSFTIGKSFKFGNKCYLTEESQRYLFHENFAFCQSLNATTVSIHSVQEDHFLKAKLTENGHFWLGIRQVNFNASTYAWFDGSVYDYNNWNYRGGEKTCAGAYIWNGLWRDYIDDCIDKNFAFCQIDFDSISYKMQMQIQQLQQQLEEERNHSDQKWTQTTTLVWILGALLIIVIGTLILAVNIIRKQMRSMKREMKQSNAALLEQNPTNNNY